MKIGYARVSTDEQNLDLQTDALEEAGCERIYTDKTSGKKWDRTGLAGAVEQLRAGDVLVVWRLDRLGRSIKDLIEQVERIEELGAQFASLQEGIDTTTPNGRFTFHVFGALSEFESRLVSQRTKAGLKAAKKRGRRGGRPRAIAEEDIPMICRLMREPKATTREICRAYGVSKSTLYRYVSPEGERRMAGEPSK